jgi:hypothetical protein
MSNDTPCAAALEERNGTAMACQAGGSHACVHSFSGLNCRYSLKSEFSIAIMSRNPDRRPLLGPNS